MQPRPIALGVHPVTAYSATAAYGYVDSGGREPAPEEGDRRRFDLSPLFRTWDVSHCRRMEPAFKWRCPTYGCRGVIVQEKRPEDGAVAFCTAREPPEPFCGQKMRYDLVADEWLPFRGFR